MAWVEADFYRDEWNKGNEPVIPFEVFSLWEDRAVDTINWRKVKIDAPPLFLKKCVCAVAEALYQNAQAKIAQSDGLKSEKNAEYSWTAADIKPDAEQNAELSGIINRYLAFTELHGNFIYAGLK